MSRWLSTLCDLISQHWVGVGSCYPSACTIGTHFSYRINAMAVHGWRTRGRDIANRALHWRHNERDVVSSHQPYHCLLNSLFRRRSKKTLKLRVTGLCEGHSPGTGDFPAQKAGNAANVSIWWRHHGIKMTLLLDISRHKDFDTMQMVHHMLIKIHPWSSGRCGIEYEYVISEHMLRIKFMCIFNLL